MRKKLSIMVIIFVIFTCTPINAEEQSNVYYFWPGWPVLTIEDIYAINDMYIDTPDMQMVEIWDKVTTLAEEHLRVTLDYAMSYSVVSEDGYVNYICVRSEQGVSAGDHAACLISYATGDSFQLDEPREKLEEFLKEQDEYARKIREECRNQIVTDVACDFTGNETAKEIIEKNMTSSMSSEELVQEMIECMDELKKKYPAYTYENLYSLVFYNRDEKSYLNADKELAEFLTGLSYTGNEKNELDEALYGDPEKLAIKALLAKYQELYQKENYETLYAKYIKEISENSDITQCEKRGRYIWDLLKVQEDLKKKTNSEGTDGLPIVIAGCVMLALGMVGIIITKKRGEIDERI